MANGEIKSEVGKVMKQANAEGEKKISLIPFDHLNFSGCHSHPSLADDQIINDALIPFIAAHPGIWQTLAR